MEGGTQPDEVARVIWGAVQENGAKLRYPVGPDAEAIIAARDRMTAAEWAAIFADEDEDKFLANAQAASVWTSTIRRR